MQNQLSNKLQTLTNEVMSYDIFEDFAEKRVESIKRLKRTLFFLRDVTQTKHHLTRSLYDVNDFGNKVMPAFTDNIYQTIRKFEIDEISHNQNDLKKFSFYFENVLELKIHLKSLYLNEKKGFELLKVIVKKSNSTEVIASCLISMKNLASIFPKSTDKINEQIDKALDRVPVGMALIFLVQELEKETRGVGKIVISENVFKSKRIALLRDFELFRSNYF